MEPMSFGQEESLTHLLFGSVASRAVELAQCPVLVVKLLSASD
jgi:nucleotide-binding universal stress UspA family protein